jgi:hypothetical protein
LKRDPTRFTFLDLLLIAALVALPAWALVRSWRATNGQSVAYVYQNNRLLGAYRLDRDQVILIGNRARPDMKIEIRGGAIRVAESDCPKGICKQAGWIRTPGRSIMCVPNRVLIQLKGASSEYDAESY